MKRVYAVVYSRSTLARAQPGRCKLRAPKVCTYHMGLKQENYMVIADDIALILVAGI